MAWVGGIDREDKAALTAMPGTTIIVSNARNMYMNRGTFHMRFTLSLPFHSAFVCIGHFLDGVPPPFALFTSNG